METLDRLAETESAAPPGPDGLRFPLPHPGVNAFHSATGQLDIGQQADGRPASWRLWSEAGARHALIAAGGGVGATNTLRGVLRGLAGSKMAHVWVADPGGRLLLQDGRLADRYADARAQVDKLLSDAMGVILRRRSHLREVGTRWGRPSPSMPLGVLVLPRIDDVVLRPFAEYIERLCRYGRVVGVSVIAGVSDHSLSSFASNPHLRERFLTANHLVLRTATCDALFLTPEVGERSPLPAHFSDGTPTAGLGRDGAGNLLRTYLVAD